MKREDAYYHMILLKFGLDDGYFDWLDKYLNEEDPLSDIVLELASCGSSIDKIISCLYRFCGEEKFDEAAVRDRLRLFLKEEYRSGRMNKEGVILNMYRFACYHGAPYGAEFDEDVWGSMFYMEDYYCLTQSGLLSKEKFNLVFYSYLNEGVRIDMRDSKPAKITWKDKLFSGMKRLFKH